MKKNNTDKKAPYVWKHMHKIKALDKSTESKSLKNAVGASDEVKELAKEQTACQKEYSKATKEVYKTISDNNKAITKIENDSFNENQELMMSAIGKTKAEISEITKEIKTIEKEKKKAVKPLKEEVTKAYAERDKLTTEYDTKRDAFDKRLMILIKKIKPVEK